MTTDPQTDRIPIAHSVVYAVRGMPEVPAEYTKGLTLAPTEITLTYRAAPDGQLGRVHAYVKGWWMQRDGERYPTDKPVGQHYYGGPNGWPVWLAEEARLHDPDAASSAVSVVPPATNQTARDRVAEALLTTRRTDYEGAARHGEHRYDARCALCAGDVDALADAVLAVLPAPADRAAEARVRALHQEYAFGDDPQVYCAHCNQISGGWIPWPCPTVQALDDGPSRGAAEAPHTGTPDARPRCPHCQMPHDLTPGSLPVAVCASTRHRIAEAERLHPQGDHSLCCRVDCDAITAPAVVAQPGKETQT